MPIFQSPGYGPNPIMINFRQLLTPQFSDSFATVQNAKSVIKVSH
jgi:hypothetical protein